MGANRNHVLRLILRQGIRLAGVGLAIGLAASLAVTRLMTALLFAVSPTDLPTFVVVSVLLATVALAASFFPPGEQPESIQWSRCGTTESKGHFGPFLYAT